MTDDLIRRQEAIEIAERYHRVIKECDYVFRELADELCNLPSTEQQRKKGKWIKMSDADGIYWRCSECGEDLPRTSHFDREYDLIPHLKSIEKTNYCPNCGADMRGVE